MLINETTGQMPPDVRCCNSPAYSAIIRTFNCAKTLFATLLSLQNQGVGGCVIIVDSGSTDETLDLAPPSAIIHQFVGTEFNYSEALNQGIEYAKTKYIVIISSHTSLENRSALGYAIDLMESDNSIGAAYFIEHHTSELRHDLIDKYNFDGTNGLFNTCSVIRTSLVKERRFRPEVFAAEDQEWASWLFTERSMRIARISGGGLINRNPRRFSYRKRLNDYLGVACFSNRKLLSLRHLSRVAMSILVPPGNIFGIKDRFFMAVLLVKLIACRFGRINQRSRYF